MGGLGAAKGGSTSRNEWKEGRSISDIRGGFFMRDMTARTKGIRSVLKGKKYIRKKKKTVDVDFELGGGKGWGWWVRVGWQNSMVWGWVVFYFLLNLFRAAIIFFVIIIVFGLSVGAFNLPFCLLLNVCIYVCSNYQNHRTIRVCSWLNIELSIYY